MTEIYDGEVTLNANEARWIKRMRRCLKDMPRGIELVANATSNSFTVLEAGTIDEMNDSGVGGGVDIPTGLDWIDYDSTCIVITQHV